MELGKHRDRKGKIVRVRDKEDENYGNRNRMGRRESNQGSQREKERTCLPGMKKTSSKISVTF